MSPQRVSLSRRDAEALLDLVEGRIGVQMFRESAAVGRLRSALKPSPTRTAAKKERRAERAEKKATKREQRADVRAAVMARANGICECGCGHRLDEDGFLFRPEMDHFFGKSRSESIETCWLLAAAHHERKTQNFPSRVAWLEKFIEHCQRHGYAEAAACARRDWATAETKAALPVAPKGATNV